MAGRSCIECCAACARRKRAHAGHDRGEALLRSHHASLRRCRRGARFLARHRARRDRLPARTLRLRQDHAAAARRRRRGAGAGPHPDQRPRGVGRRELPAAGAARCRPDVPGLRAVPASDQSRQCHVRAEGAAEGGSRARGDARARPRRAWRATRRPIRTCCRAASSSAWRWRARWRRGRACC